ncbi:HEAT repeat domain-containing protein [Synechococcus sp. AH-229-G18]|uniref:HEAT repeat domain-containing protein n=1 Tax=Synechococcus sp. SYN20 TaxID=1050714 RepID=UPI000D0C6C59|nr:HEAT repeat domain-containing protein [Synechococcus sp. SYN20]AVH76624.1 putative phycoerythrin:phycoerythrobilin lyase [Synechococcus sp. SYN20]MDA9149406.1 HEAT repeat domain-containing protein [Synechococcus sp. AH-229-G18]MDB4336263.1 HEAT repeat domain-containing protein [Synechococcus sp. AH-603-M21]QNJ24933.1 putative phycoerythrin:phycoerythrobilin lyase [Synechococcus sp. SYN20]
MDYRVHHPVSHPSAQPNSSDPIQLSGEEAAQLAEGLKQQLRQGEIPAGDSDAIEKMVAGLGDKRGLLRLTFAESLGAIGSAAVPSLCIAMRRHENVTVRRAAAKTLTLINDVKALPDLLEALLEDPDPVVQGSAVGAMACIGAASVDGLLDVLINPKSSQMQIGLASWGLSFVGAKAPEALRKAACSEHAQVRTAAIAALGDQIQQLDDLDARELLQNALNDPEEEVRAEATTLLGKLHDTNWGAPLLLPMLSDQHPQVRKNAALSLMKLGDPQVISKLRTDLQNEQDSSVITIFNLAINQLSRDE